MGTPAAVNRSARARTAVTGMPFVLMIAMSNSSRSPALSHRGSKPSFSTNSAALKRWQGATVPMPCRSALAPCAKPSGGGVSRVVASLASAVK